MPCLHKNLMRHEYHGEIWWQCDEGCDFIFRQSQGEAGTLRDMLKRMSDEVIADRRKYWAERLRDDINPDFWNGYDAALRDVDRECRDWRIKNLPERVEAQ